MTYNTRNPLGSSDPRDLYDNAANLDNFINGTQETYNDRVGIPKKSLYGFEQQYEQTFYDAYNNGTTYNFPNIVVCTDGYTYRCLGTSVVGDNPVTSTSGNWIVLNKNGNFIYDYNFPTLSAADTYAVSVERTLIITKTWSTVPSTLSANIYMTTGGILTQTTNFIGKFSADDSQHFTVAVTGLERSIPQWWGALGDNSHDDTAAIQSVINSGAGVLDTGSSNLVYKVSRIVGRSNLEITGNGTFDFSSNTSYASSVLDPLILFQGSAGTAVLLTANAAAEATTLQLTSTTGLAAGEMIEIATPTDTGGFVDSSIAVHNGEMLKVSSVDSPVQITLESPILDKNGYTTAHSAQIRKITPVENVTIGKEIKIVGKGRPQPSGAGDMGIVVFYGKNINIHCSIRDVDSASIYLNAYDFRVTGTTITHPLKGASAQVNYGIVYFGSSKYGDISGNTLVNMRHGVVSSHLSTVLGAFYGVSRFINIHENTIRNTWHAGIATHNDAELIDIHNNTIIGCLIGINPRDRRVSVRDNTLIHNDKHISMSAHPSELLISGNIGYGGGYFIISSLVETSGSDLSDWTIVNNKGYGTSGIYIFAGTPLTFHRNLILKDNSLNNTVGLGGNTAAIKVDGVFKGVQINGNTVNGNTSGAGISIPEGVLDAEINQNSVRNVTAYAYIFSSSIFPTGYASNVSGGTWTIANPNGPNDGIGHIIVIKNDSSTNHSAKTVVLTGTNSSDAAQSETLNLPGSSTLVRSVKYYKTLTTAVPSATIGGDTMDIGWDTNTWVKGNTAKGYTQLYGNSLYIRNYSTLSSDNTDMGATKD